MVKKSTIKNLVRARLGELRLTRKMRIKDLAERAGMPPSSYACMESGFYNISLDHLLRILGALEADIGEV